MQKWDAPVVDRRGTMINNLVKLGNNDAAAKKLFVMRCSCKAQGSLQYCELICPEPPSNLRAGLVYTLEEARQAASSRAKVTEQSIWMGSTCVKAKFFVNQIQQSP